MIREAEEKEQIKVLETNRLTLQRELSKNSDAFSGAEEKGDDTKVSEVEEKKIMRRSQRTRQNELEDWQALYVKLASLRLVDASKKMGLKEAATYTMVWWFG